MKETETGQHSKQAERHSAVKIAGAYALFSTLWIYISDWFSASLISDPHILTCIQDIKGWAFVPASSALLYILVHREERAGESAKALQGAFFEQVAVGMAQVGLDGRLLRVNEKLCAIIGYNQDELLRRTFQDLTHPDDVEAHLAYVRQLLAGEIQTYSMENRYFHKNGATLWVNLTVAPVRDTTGRTRYLICVIEDITGRKGEQDLLREQAAQLDMAQILVHDMDGRIVHWNRGAEHLYGYTASEALGRNIHELLHTQCSRPLSEIEAQVFESGQWEGELTHTARNRRRVVVASLWFAYQNPAGRPDLLIQVNNDITAMKLAEEEIRQLNLRLEKRVTERTAQLQSANQELEAFSYSVSHDLRAPLRAISGFAQILANRHREALNEEGRRYMDNIVLASERMGELIDDLLAYSRLGRKAVSHRPVGLHEVFSFVTGDLAARVAESGATITIAQDLPSVSGDPTLLQQIFANLVGNALIYRKPDISPHVEVKCRAQDDYVIISVADNGIGIEEEYQKKIFNVFQRLHSEDEYPGTGIGLAIVKKSVEMLGGEVWVESKLGKGSTFFVRLRPA